MSATNNVIIATFGTGREARTRSLFQYDYGIILKFEGLELPSTYEVHFSNYEHMGDAVTAIGGEDGVTVPQSVLANGNDVEAYLYLHTGENDGETVYHVKIPVTPRAKPNYDMPTPEEQTVMQTLIAQTAEATTAANNAADAANALLDDIPAAVEEVEEAIEAKGEEVIESIPQDYTALTAEVTTLKSDLINTNSVLSDQTDVDFTDATAIRGLINTSNIWSGTEGFYSYLFAITGEYHMAIVTANAESVAIVGLLNAMPTISQAVPYCTGTSKITIPAGTTQYIDIPSDCAYIVVTKSGTSDVDYTPEGMAFYAWKDIPVVDDSLSIAGEAADAKATGDKISAITDDNLVAITESLTDEISVFINSNNIWSTSGKCLIKAIPPNTFYVTITANADNYASIAFLKTNDHTGGESPNYATGSSVTAIPANETKEFEIPDDAEYIYIQKSYSTTNRLPSYVKYYKFKQIPDIDASFTIEGAAADAKVTGDKINRIVSAITETDIVDIGSATTIRGLINTSNVWSTSAGFSSYAFNVTPDYYALSVTADTEKFTTVGLLKNSELHHSTTPTFCDGITGRIDVPAGTTAEITIPSDCKYIVILKTGSNIDYTPANIVFSRWGISASDTAPLGLHETPRSESALNIVKRCRQMTDIKWTPAVDLYRYMLVQRSGVIPDTAESQHYFGTFKAGTEYTGIPYGRVASTMRDYGYDYATVAHYIPLETFVSSVSNADSKLCKEDVHSLNNHISVLYATVCSGLTCYALDVPEVPTASIGNISGLTQIGKINDNGTEIADSAFQIGDVLNLAGNHTAIVTDIIRDNEGTIQSIELSDASTAGLADRNYSDGQIGGICRRKGWSRTAIYSPGSWGDYTIYRYTGNVPYTSNPYVNVGNEFNMQRIEHFPCMPYEGNKFTYKVGYIPNNTVKILVSLSGYSYLKVFKNGTEISGSPFTVTDETASIDVTEISAGTYSAYLCNITNGDVINLTYPCEWTITE